MYLCSASIRFLFFYYFFLSRLATPTQPHPRPTPAAPFYIYYIYIQKYEPAHVRCAHRGEVPGSNPSGGSFLTENVTICTYSEGGQNGQKPYVFHLFCHFRNPLRGRFFKTKYSPLKHIRLGPKPFEGSPFLIIFQYFSKYFMEIHKAHSKYLIFSTPFALSGLGGKNHEFSCIFYDLLIIL